MIILLSPAKSLDFESPAKTKTSTQPVFQDRSAELIKTLRKLSQSDIAKLMKLSDALSELNVKRYKDWKKKHDQPTSKQAAYAFQGDVYKGLAIDEWSAASVKRGQKHIRVLSGLYGMLRPLDLIQPYRLEMGTKLKTGEGKDLYAFWDETIRNAITSDLAAQKSNLIVNLASNEYSKAAKLKTIDAEIVSPVFKDWKNGQYKMISFFAKRARGLMARHLIENSIKSTDDIKTFKSDGYRFDKKLSTEAAPVFTRKQAN